MEDYSDEDMPELVFNNELVIDLQNIVIIHTAPATSQWNHIIYYQHASSDFINRNIIYSDTGMNNHKMINVFENILNQNISDPFKCASVEAHLDGIENI